MPIDVNSITILNGIFVLGWLHNIDLNLNFIFFAYNLEASKGKAYTFHLQPKKCINFFTDLLMSDKLWEDEERGMFAIGGLLPSPNVNLENFPVPRIFTKGASILTSLILSSSINSISPSYSFFAYLTSSLSS